MFVTVELLKSHKACQEQVDLFAAAFPDGAQVTEAVCLAVSDKFDFIWATCLLPREARAGYKAKREAIQAEYRAKLAPILAEYEAKRAALFGRIAENLGD